MGYSFLGGSQVKGWHSQKGRTHPCINCPLTSEKWTGKGNTQTHPPPFASYTLLSGVISPLDTSKESLTCTDNMPLSQQGPVSLCWLWRGSHFHPFLCLVSTVFHSVHLGLEFPKESGSTSILPQALISNTNTVKVKSLSHVGLFATPWTVAYQAPPSTGFSKQEYWSGLPLPSPRDESY